MKTSFIDEVFIVLQIAAVFMKHEGFSAEHEYRIVRLAEDVDVQIRESRRRLVPFIDLLKGMPPLPLARIILGPAWQLSSLQETDFQKHHVTLGVRRMLDLHGLTSVDVARSAIPYDPS